MTLDLRGGALLPGRAWIRMDRPALALPLQTDALRALRLSPPVGARDVEGGLRASRAVGRLEVRYRVRRESVSAEGSDVLFTRFHTSRWMPVDMSPSRAATLGLTLRHPRGWTVFGTGRPVARGPTESRFALRTPHPGYLFGFVAGPGLRRDEIVRDGVVHELIHPGFDAEQRVTLAEKAAAAIALFSRLASVPYEGERFTQAWIEADVAQELAYGATMSAAQARVMFAEPTEDWLLVHEVAHAFWGNRVRAASWSEFWLNEGFATFMTAVFKERTWGRAAYSREVELARARLARLNEAGRDRPLTARAGTTADEAGGPLVYCKGMLFLHALRERMGDAAFFAGVADYTRAGWDRGTDSRALYRAMQRHSASPLARLFERYGARYRR